MPPAAPRAVAYTSPCWPGELRPNGVGTSVGHLVEAIRGLGRTAWVVTDDVEPGCDDPNVEDLKRHGTDGRWARRAADALVYRVSPTRWRANQVRRSLGGALGRLAREDGVEVAELEEAHGYPGLIREALDIPLVVRLHGPWFLNGEALGVRRDRAFDRRVHAEGEAIASAAGVTAPSQDVLDRVRRYYGLSLPGARAIPNPMPPVAENQRWRMETSERGRILFVGRFDRHKGGDTIIEAFARLAGKNPGCRLTFVGPDRGLIDETGRRWSIREYLVSRVTDAGVRDRIEWLGPQPRERIAELRLRSAVTVACSRYETFGNTALEAMAQGCPVIASQAGGLAEIVDDGVTGLSCRPGDAAHLAERLSNLMDDPALGERLGREAAVEVGRRFHPRVIASRCLTFYAGLTARVAGREVRTP